MKIMLINDIAICKENGIDDYAIISPGSVRIVSQASAESAASHASYEAKRSWNAHVARINNA